jgi:hypothetical protein
MSGGQVHIVFEDFEDISPELEDRIRETLLVAGYRRGTGIGVP